MSGKKLAAGKALPAEGPSAALAVAQLTLFLHCRTQPENYSIRCSDKSSSTVMRAQSSRRYSFREIVSRNDFALSPSRVLAC
jgi:hypothetical protein